MKPPDVFALCLRVIGVVFVFSTMPILVVQLLPPSSPGRGLFGSIVVIAIGVYL